VALLGTVTSAAETSWRQSYGLILGFPSDEKKVSLERLLLDQLPS